MTKTWQAGTRQTEIDAYAFLHAEGFSAFDAKYGRIGSAMINSWADQGKVRVTYPAGCLAVKTFKKYAA